MQPEQLPDYEDYSLRNRTYRFMEETPLFPFGYGLSYTRFSYGKAKTDRKRIAEGESATLCIPVRNVGKYDGEEVVQIYIRKNDDAEGPVKTLRAYRRVAVPQGTETTVKTLPYSAFEWYDARSESMRPQKGSYTILYGSSSDPADLQKLEIRLK